MNHVLAIYIDEKTIKKAPLSQVNLFIRHLPMQGFLVG